MSLFTMMMKRPRLLSGSLAPAVIYVLSLSLLAACGAGRSLHFAPSVSEISVDSGNGVILQCVLGGDSTHGGSFSWTGPAVTRDRAVITLDSSGTVSTLTIADAGGNDEGSYSCSFTGVATISITLDVVFDPHFLNVSEYQEFIEETDAVVECPAFFGDPQGNMVWTRDDVIVTGDRFTGEDGRMRIQNIQESDGGVYRCSIRLLGIVDSRDVTVNVLERDSLAPRIVEPSNPIEVVYGNPLDILCQLEEQRNDVHYTWTVDTDYEDNHFKNTTPSLHRDAHNFLGGRYTCKAENIYGYDEQVFHVRILAPPEPRECSEEDETRTEGDTVVLEHCGFTSPVQLSDLHFQWSVQYGNGEWEMIIPNGRFSVNHKGFLTISNVQPSDSGLYRVDISNDWGSALHRVRLQVTPGPTTEPPNHDGGVELTLRFELSGSDGDDNPDVSCQDIKDMQPSFTSALQKAICDEFPMCSQDSDIGLRDAMITCSDSSSGIFSAIVGSSNAAKIVENVQQFDEFTVNLNDEISVSLIACSESDTMCATALPGVRNGQSSGLVAGVVISVLFLVAMVIAAAILVTIIIFKYRKRTNQISDTDQLERGGGGGETATPSSQAQSQVTVIGLSGSTVSPNMAAMTTDLAGITTSTHPHPIMLQLPPLSMATQDTDRTLTLQVAAASSSTNRPVRPSDLRIPGQNGHKKKPLYGRSISLDLPPRQQTLNHHMRS